MSDIFNNYAAGFAGEWVEKDAIKPTDILSGRGSGSNDREGNIHFRNRIKERKVEYMTTDSRPLKKKIAIEIVSVILASGCRFLKKADANDSKKLGIPEGIDAWCILRRDAMYEKVKQALRQKSWAPSLCNPRQQSAGKKKRRANELSPDSVKAKKIRSQMVPQKLEANSQVVSSFQAEPSSIDLMNDMHFEEGPEPLDFEGDTASSQETLNTNYSSQTSSPKSTLVPWDVDYCGDPIELKGEVIRSVSISNNDAEEWDDCEEFCGKRFYPCNLEGDDSF